MRIGLTGNIAAGKGEVARLLAQFGCIVVDADALAHTLYREKPELVAALAAHFGEDILAADGSLNRQALGSKVFRDPAALEALNAHVRPALQEAILRRIVSAEAEGKTVVLDAALIVEWGWAKDFDALWVVTCPEALRKERLMRRNGLGEEEAQARIDSQIPESGKAEVADLILDNSGSPEALRELVEKAWQDFRKTRAEA